MTDIKWGPAIAVDGKRPEFVSNGDAVLLPWEDMPVSKSGRAYGAWASGTLWKDIPSLRLPADHPYYRQTEAAPIDWSGELEAVHEDGRVVSVTLAPNAHGYSGSVPRVTNECPAEDTNDNWYEDGTDFCRDGKWRIRNVPQPTPQADTKPDLTARAPCMTISEVREMVAKGEDAVIATMLERGYALPEPVDEDLIEARKLAHEFVGDRTSWQGVLEGKHDSSPAITQLIAAIKRGRALALAGEKEA